MLKQVIMSFLAIIISESALPLGDLVTKPIQVDFLSSTQDLSSLLALPERMPQLDDPKELPEQPACLCFHVNIANFLPEKKMKKPVYGCVFSDQTSMNSALLRAGLYIHTSSGMPSDHDLFSSKLMSKVGGHDFDGKELLRFYQAYKPIETHLPEYQKLRLIESTFQTRIVDRIIEENHDNFIFFAIINTKTFKENLTHELLHAQYYNLPSLSTLLLTVWKEQVTKKHQKLFTETLQKAGYDMTQEELLLREFYSYLMQHNAQEYLNTVSALTPIASLAPLYTPKITSALKQEGIPLLSVDL